MMIEFLAMVKNNEKNNNNLNVQKSYHGDYLSYLGHKNASHYMSKVDFKL